MKANLQQQEDIATLSRIHPTMTNSDIATILNCSKGSVATYRNKRTHGICPTCKTRIEVSSKEYCKHQCRPSYGKIYSERKKPTPKVDVKAEALKRYNKFKGSLYI